MDVSTRQEISLQFFHLIRVYKDGTVERLIGTDFVSPSIDPLTGVTSKDVTINNFPQSDYNSARLYLPNLTNPNQKLPLLIYFHGGGFIAQSPFTSTYHNYLNTLTAKAEVISVSVNYRKAPEHPIPAAYEDSWAALQWVASHCEKEGSEVWLNEHADFGRVFLAGISAGANIAHNLAMVAGDPEFGLSMGILGVALEHPYFWGSSSIGSEALDLDRKNEMDRFWPFLCPSMPDNDDPHVNPVADGAPSLAGLGCMRVLVCVAEKDLLRDRGRLYYEAMGRSGRTGVVEFMETEGEDHAFHLHNLESEKAKDLVRRLAAFFNRDAPPFL